MFGYPFLGAILQGKFYIEGLPKKRGLIIETKGEYNYKEDPLGFFLALMYLLPFLLVSIMIFLFALGAVLGIDIIPTREPASWN